MSDPSLTKSGVYWSWNKASASFENELSEEASDVEIIAKHTSVELKRIYVLKEYHSQKAGAALMNFALNFAAEKMYELVWLGVWEHNEKAKSFYKKFGFENTGATHFFPIGNTPQTDCWLIKFINPRTS